MIKGASGCSHVLPWSHCQGQSEPNLFDLHITTGEFKEQWTGHFIPTLAVHNTMYRLVDCFFRFGGHGCKDALHIFATLYANKLHSKDRQKLVGNPYEIKILSLKLLTDHFLLLFTVASINHAVHLWPLKLILTSEISQTEKFLHISITRCTAFYSNFSNNSVFPTWEG